MAADPWLVDLSNTDKDSSIGFDDDFKPFIKMTDSGSYISTLENKLKLVRGDDHQLTGQTMLLSVERIKDDLMSTLLQDRSVPWDSLSNHSMDEFSVIDGPLQTFLKLKLCPEKCAMSVEELQSLLKADQLNLINENLAAEAARKPDDSEESDLISSNASCSKEDT